MGAVTIPVVVGADRRLVIDLPDSTPVGPADVVILSRTSGESGTENPARDAARAKLLAADFLVTDVRVPEGTRALSDKDIARLGRLAPSARPSEALVNEDRGAY